MTSPPGPDTRTVGAGRAGAAPGSGHLASSPPPEADRTARPGPGRPRSPEADQAIDRAALELLAEAGFEGVTIEAVAARARVARSTVYRRTPNKVALLMDAAERAAEQTHTIPDTGSIEGDLMAVARRLHRMLTDSLIGRTVPAAIAATARHPELATAHRSIVGRRREQTKAVIARAIQRAELPTEVDIDLLLDLVTAPIFYRVLISGEPVSDRYLRGVVTTAINGARTP